jgi:hypothetical protein
LYCITSDMSPRFHIVKFTDCIIHVRSSHMDGVLMKHLNVCANPTIRQTSIVISPSFFIVVNFLLATEMV